MCHLFDENNYHGPSYTAMGSTPTVAEAVTISSGHPTVCSQRSKMSVSENTSDCTKSSKTGPILIQLTLGFIHDICDHQPKVQSHTPLVSPAREAFLLVCEQRYNIIPFLQLSSSLVLAFWLGSHISFQLLVLFRHCHFGSLQAYIIWQDTRD